MTLFFALAASLPGIGMEGPKSDRARAIESQRARLEEQLARFGGEVEIEKALTPFKEKVTSEIRGHRGHRSEMGVGEMIYNSEICKAAILSRWRNQHERAGRGADPLEVIVAFDRILTDLGVDLFVVPVPSKIEAYPGNFGVSLPEGIPVSLGRTRFMLDLLERFVEVIDVLPAVLAAAPEAEYPLYETVYHHHSGLGARTVGEAVGRRLSRYGLKGESSFAEAKRKTHERHHPDVPMWAWAVVDGEGEPYAHVPDSPVAIIGDSNAFAHGTASWSAHIARSLGIPVTEVARGGGGPTAHVRLAELGRASLEARKAVVWIVTSSHIQRHRWAKAVPPGDATVTGLVAVGKIEEARKRVEGLLKSGGTIQLDEESATSLAAERVAGGDFQEATRILEVVTLAHPDSAAAFERLGETQVEGGDLENGKKSLLRALALNPVSRTIPKLLDQIGAEYEVPEPTELTEEEVSALLGTYEVRPGETVRVIGDRDVLFAKFSNNPRMGLIPTSSTRFVTRRGFSLQFVLGSDGRATQVQLQLGSQRLVASRLEE